MIHEICICAAVLTDEGYPMRGHRHCECYEAIEKAGLQPKTKCDLGQGFITSLHRFVTREEGYQLQVATGIESIAKGGYRGKRLFSEDLY